MRWEGDLRRTPRPNRAAALSTPPTLRAPPLLAPTTDVEVADGEVCFVAQKSILAKLS